jgi:general stress protein 26
MTAFVNRDEHALYFLTEEDSEMVKQAREYPSVTATFSEVSGNKYLAVSGQAAVENDRAKINCGIHSPKPGGNRRTIRRSGS